MKRLVLAFAAMTTVCLFACTHAPKTAQFNADGTPNWMDAEDHVRYVQFFSRAPSATGSKYKITGTCGGYPRIDVKTAAGFCVGEVYEGAGLKKPRTTAVTGPNQVALVDMGSWNPFDGRIYLLNWSNGKSELKELITKKSFTNPSDPRRTIIDRPHQITRGPDGKYYVGSVTSLVRFDPLARNPVDTIEVLITGMPAQGLHPLKAFTFDEQGGIYINVGSATNVCQKSGVQGERKSLCDEAENMQLGQAQIRRYQFMNDRKVSPQFEVYAKGLRNSIALTWDKKRSVLLQGENGRDAINKYNPNISTSEFPHEELNIVEKGKHYGWPYCYDDNKANPEWTNVDCSRFEKPYIFLPPHSAPLALHYYEGTQFPAWYRGRLLATLHGYEPKGHRLVAFKRDDRGLPTGTAQSVIYGWDTKGDQKYGSPVGLTELPDGSLMIVEDTNQKVLRLFFDSTKGDGAPVQELDQASVDLNPQDPAEEEKRKLRLIDKMRDGNAPPFTQFQAKVIDKTCYTCHGGENAPGVQLLRYDDDGNALRIRESGKAQEILEMMRGNPNYPPMPPQGFDSTAEQKEAARLIEAWVKTNPTR